MSSLATPGQASGIPIRPKVRLHWVDFVRAQNIFYVVLVHVYRGLNNSGVYPETPWFYWMTYFWGSFLMPGFFFLSGLFVMSSASKPFKIFLRDKWQTIAYPYLVWSLLYSLMLAAMSNWTNQKTTFSDVWRLIYLPPGQFWFIYTLFVSMLLFAIAIRLKVKPLGIFILSVAFYCTSFFSEINLGPWGVVFLVRHNMMYLALGALIGRGGKPLLWLNGAKSSHLFAIIAVCYPFTLWCVLQGGREILWVRPFLALTGGAGTFCIAILLFRSGYFKFFEYFGRRSLEIYVAHVFGLAGIRIVLQKVLGIENVPLHFVLGALAGVYVPTAIGYVVSRMGFPYLYSLKKVKRPVSIQTPEQH